MAKIAFNAVVDDKQTKKITLLLQPDGVWQVGLTEHPLRPITVMDIRRACNTLMMIHRMHRHQQSVKSRIAKTSEQAVLVTASSTPASSPVPVMPQAKPAELAVNKDEKQCLKTK